MLLRLPSKLQKSILEKIPLKRWGKPKEVVETILFLCSDNSSYLTGQVINLNGGYIMQ